MKRLIPVALLTALLAGCAHDSPCVPVYDDQGRLVHTNTCMKGTTFRITGKRLGLLLAGQRLLLA